MFQMFIHDNLIPVPNHCQNIKLFKYNRISLEFFILLEKKMLNAKQSLKHYYLKQRRELMTAEKDSTEYYFCSVTYLKHMLKMKTQALIHTKAKSEMSQPAPFVTTKCQIYNNQTFQLSTMEQALLECLHSFIKSLKQEEQNYHLFRMNYNQYN